MKVVPRSVWNSEDAETEFQVVSLSGVLSRSGTYSRPSCTLKIPPVSLAKVLYISKKYIAMKLTNVEVSNASGLLGDSFAYATMTNLDFAAGSSHPKSLRLASTSPLLLLFRSTSTLTNLVQSTKHNQLLLPPWCFRPMTSRPRCSKTSYTTRS